MTRPDPERSTADEAWLMEIDHLLDGINHMFSNRLAAIRALVWLMQGEAGDARVQRALGSEADLLERSFRLLRMLPRSRTGKAEPIQLPELLREVIELHRHHAGMREARYSVECEGEPLPVWLNESALVRALLLLLSGAARGVRHSEDSEVRVRCQGDEAFVTLVVESDGVAVDSEEEPGVDPARAAAEMLRGTGAELAVETSPRRGTRYRLRLLTLPEVRRRERAAKDS